METRKRIKRLREKLGYTQEKLARELNVSLVSVARWELGTSEPSPMAIEKIEHLERKSDKSRSKEN